MKQYYMPIAGINYRKKAVAVFLKDRYLDQVNVITNLLKNGGKARFNGHNEKLVLEKDPDNEYDENAVQIKFPLIHTKQNKNVKIGYVPQQYSEPITEILDMEDENTPELISCYLVSIAMFKDENGKNKLSAKTLIIPEL